MEIFNFSLNSSRPQWIADRPFICLIFILFMLSPMLSAAQGYIEGVNISYEHIPMKIDSSAGNQKFTGNNLKVSATIPIFLKADKSRYLIVGGNLEAFNFSGTHPDFEVKRVYSISPTFGYSTMLSKSFNLTALLTPTMNSDYKDVKSSDIKFGAIVRGSWKASEKITWKAILGYRRQFYGPQYVVLVGMDWKVNDKWQIFGDVPHNLTASYAINQKMNTGFNLFVQNSTYRLNNMDRYFEYNTVNPGLFLERYVSSKWAVRATAAYTLIRNMEIYNKNDKADGFVDFYELGDRKDPINPEVSPGLSFKIGLSYRIFPGRK
ncbi:DUF6268 family outer membrane beta-barrel protein [Pedobacter sp. MC2016-15]|uniref:DUF6268 family outer membrane beta-barrel protein n=1 Tax=Pedobacter sp. MC2016-15 TaxID=2994473 RepID=UPI0022472E0A|nr:DUF6268 family outer membrane beta-barrel protein [Pedobacter sp. MC2016-15]MCX2478016.1 DUF6268 family outer membrane beta-barrel protein [Pedobacter sp. MC2016-15]